MMPRSQLPREPVQPVTEHINRLRAGGMNILAIAAASGLPTGTVYAVAQARNTWINGYTARAILAVETAIPTAPANHEFAVGSRRRARALARIGHRQYAVRDAMGIYGRQFFMLVSGQSQYIQADHAANLRTLYDAWSEYDGTSIRTRTWAIKAGWHGPEAWNDDIIDNPNAEPLTGASVVDDVAINLVINGDDALGQRLNTAERRQAVRVADSLGMTKTSLARLLHVNNSTIERLRSETQVAA